MKTEYCVYRDHAFEDKARAGLDDDRRSIQMLLNQWNAMKIGPCPEINLLVMRPDRLYKQVIDKLVEVPATAGPFKISKEAHVQTLDLPDPSMIIELSKKVRQQGYCSVPALWSISDDGMAVVLVQSEAEILIDQRSIYASDPQKIKLIQRWQGLCQTMSNLNIGCRGELLPSNQWTHNWARGKFILHQKFTSDPFEVLLDPDWVKRLLRLPL